MPLLHPACCWRRRQRAAPRALVVVLVVAARCCFAARAPAPPPPSWERRRGVFCHRCCCVPAAARRSCRPKNWRWGRRGVRQQHTTIRGDCYSIYYRFPQSERPMMVAVVPSSCAAVSSSLIITCLSRPPPDPRQQQRVQQLRGDYRRFSGVHPFTEQAQCVIRPPSRDLARLRPQPPRLAMIPRQLRRTGSRRHPVPPSQSVPERGFCDATRVRYMTATRQSASQ